jgi:transcriptional regulator with XRE-family HTH domain
MADIVDSQALKALRDAKGWDQLTLARRAGINPSVVSRLERGLQPDVRASALVALAHALSVPINALVMKSYQQTEISALPELAVVLAEVARQPKEYQRQVVALLRAYLSSMPPQGTRDL